MALFVCTGPEALQQQNGSEIPENMNFPAEEEKILQFCSEMDYFPGMLKATKTQTKIYIL